MLRSEPQPGSELLISDTVTLFVAGPTVKVPDVVRKKEADAKIAIEAAQLEALIALDWVASSEVGTVLKTEPAAESSVQRQTKVTLYVTGKGGWLYREGNNFAVGQTVTMRSAGTLRKTPATTGAVAGGAVIAGDKVKVLEKAPYGWVKVVVVPN